MKLSVIGTTNDPWAQELEKQIPQKVFTRTMLLLGSPAQLLVTLFARILWYRVIWLSDNAEHNTFTRFLLKIVSLLAAAIIVPNQRAETSLLRMGIASTKLKLIYPACAFTNTPPEKDTICLAYDGSIGMEHGLGTVLKAVAEAQDIINNLKLIIGGIVPEKAKILWLARELNLEHVIQIVPTTSYTWSSPAQVYLLMNNEHQSVPVSLAQAMSFGQAVIATDVLANHEFLEQNKHALLVKPNNSQMLAQAIINLARNPEWITTLGKNNKNFARKKFQAKITNEALKQCITRDNV
jgi:glycosyltransferase involved in cell wall biosynthesis